MTAQRGPVMYVKDAHVAIDDSTRIAEATQNYQFADKEFWSLNNLE